MTRDWKTNKQLTDSDQIHDCWTDLILDDKFGITKEKWNAVIEQTVEHIRGWAEKDIKGRVSGLVDLLLPPLETLWQGKTGEPSFRWFRWLPSKSLKGATVADHALTASAIAYCLAYDLESRPDIDTLDKLRLSALTATWKADGLENVYNALWTGHEPIEPNPDGSEHEQIVFLAKTAASERTEIEAVQFNDHPLNKKKQIGLVLGGATKIKGYFLESAKLPEIRGASALLDRINLEDVPALFGRKNRHDPKRGERFHKDFCERTGHNLSAPECIIYAAGGNTLAFAPASVVHQIADEIERIYTTETLVANSVAVGDTFDLLELQYGLNPTQFWIQEYQKACGTPETKKIMHTYYGNDFLKRKCFGELTSKLAGAQLKRREGNTAPDPDRKTQRDLPVHVEIGSYQTRCESCERRPAVINEPKVLCEACTRKYVAGRATKKQLKSGELNHYTDTIEWLPANKGEKGEYLLTDWISLYHDYVKLSDDDSRNYDDDSPNDAPVPDGPNDLSDIAKASKTENYVALIYADGNNMGGYLENIKTPAQYRQFSERVFVTMQTVAFKALAKLEPIWIKDDNVRYVFPFEVISIGGDDLVLIVPGDKALEIVHEIGVNFDKTFMSHSVHKKAKSPSKAQRYQSQHWENEADSKLPQFSMSLGFVIANEHTPVAFMEDLAGKLLKSAKTRAKMLKKKFGYTGGTVDFFSLKSLSMIASELKNFRDQLYKTDNKDSLTMRPFTLHELSGFIKTIKDFKKGQFPQSQLYQLRESLKLGRATSTLDYLYFRTRLDSEDGDRLQEQIEHNWQGITNNNGNLGPWYLMLKAKETDDERYETLLLDLIEAYDFIPEPAKNEEDNSDESND